MTAPWTEDLRGRLDELLEEHREGLRRQLDDLTEQEARRRLVPAETTHLSLLKHVTYVERVWYDHAVTDRTLAQTGAASTPERSWVLRDHDTIASVSAAPVEACEHSRRADLFPSGRVRNDCTFSEVDLEARCEIERVPGRVPRRIMRWRPTRGEGLRDPSGGIRSWCAEDAGVRAAPRRAPAPRPERSALGSRQASPSCSSMLSLSHTMSCWTILPPSTRAISTPSTSTVLPVAGASPPSGRGSGPVLVPRTRNSPM